MRIVGVIVLLILFSFSAGAQVLINEFAASNSTLIEDPDFKDFADWIELYNAGSVEVEIGGYYITDDLDTPRKWQVTVDTVIAPGGFLLLWADGLNTGLHTGFKLSAVGEEIGLFSAGLELIDTLSYSEQKTDVSYGRVPDGAGQWAYFSQATPGGSNSTEFFMDYTSLIPKFSMKGGFYSSSFSVELSSLQGGIIRYTTDGSEPTDSSDVYFSAIGVEATTILRARIFEEGKIPGPVVTHSYFINENSVGGKLPVVSIASDPDNFWDAEKGIYVQDFKPGWEIPINIEFFENDGSDRAAFNEQAGTKVNGLYSWQLPQKMLGVYFRKQYGEGSLDYPLFHHRERSGYKSFALRAGGSDWSTSLFRDILAHHSTLENMDIEIMDYRPSVVYINGEYMGIHNIREKVDDDYIEKSYQLESGSFDLVENENYAEAGDTKAYDYLETLLNEDLSDEAKYSEVEALVDIENVTDYFIAEMACENTSVSHNVMAWKPKDYGKWKWVLMDLDRGFVTNPNDKLIDFYRSQSVLILRQLMNNQSYKDYFALRLSSHLFTSYNPGRMKGLIEEHEEALEDEIPVHIARWEGTTSSYGNAMPSEEFWRTWTGRFKTFAEERPWILMNDLQTYGYESPANLSLGVVPEGAGSFTMDGLSVPGSAISGPFLKNMPVDLVVKSNPGFGFLGWAIPQNKEIVSRGADWLYLDTGIDPGEDWILTDFDDEAWKSGTAQLGYGDGDESTVVSYGGNEDYKHMTTWFRKSFHLDEGDLDAPLYILELLRDDGAIVYLNGKELLRSNMSQLEITPESTAFWTVNADQESNWFSYTLDKSLLLAGENILAVELHQAEAGSGDLSFDLGLSYYKADAQDIVSEGEEYALNLQGDLCLLALYESTSGCILPEVVDADMTLSADCSPWLVQGDVTISPEATLTIEPGVEIWMPEEACINVEGVVQAWGTAEERITIKLNPDYEGGSWGILSFQNTPQESVLEYVTIEDASTGPDPVRERAAISAFNADLELDNLIIEKIYGDPVLARYSDVVLTNSVLHSEVTGDLINVKYGGARIENCHFYGNDQPDTDAIDYDEVEGGIIRNCLIHGFLGFNSDAIDIGEEATLVNIDSVVIFNVTDKGVSAGQESTVSIQNSVFINCNMGIGVKDSARVEVDRSVFYNNVSGVSAFEKNRGRAGGNVSISNSILSNSSGAPYYADGKSSVEVSYSLSDNTLLPREASNLFGNPRFADPTFFDFTLLPGSPGSGSGTAEGGAVDMGIDLDIGGLEPSVMIYRIFVNADDLDLPEFICLYNPSSRKVDISGYAVTKGFTTIIPEGTTLGSEAYLYLTNNALAPLWSSESRNVFQWQEGKLSNNGEALQLEDSNGIVLDYLRYENDGFWPPEGFVGEGYFELIRPGLDNHLAENWISKPVSQNVFAEGSTVPDVFSVYPNPARDRISIYAPAMADQEVGIYMLGGQKLGEARLNSAGETSIDLRAYPPGILLIRAGNRVEKVVLY